MARIIPFKALHPVNGREQEVAVNTHTDDLAAQIHIVNTNPYSYLNVVKPYLKLNEQKDPVRHFPIASAALHELIAQKILIRDTEDSLYLYKQTDRNKDRVYIGLICTVPVEDYYQNRIRVHEKTLTEKEEQLILHIEATGAIGEPVLLTHKHSDHVQKMLEDLISASNSTCDFTDRHNIRHELFRITNNDSIELLRSSYENAGDLYIADGHHRSAASAGYFKKCGKSDGRYLVCIVPPGYLKIDSFHRAYKCDTVFDSETFLRSLGSKFKIEEASGNVIPEKEKSFGMYAGGKWFTLQYKETVDDADPVRSLDVSLLEYDVFRDLLGITDSKTDPRLNFIKGSTPCETLKAETDAGVYDLFFTVFPCAIEHVFEIADQNGIMPPKSTYIEPKLLSGLTVQLVND